MKPLILVTNDDGMFAPGIRALTEVAQEYGEVVIVAPDSPRSGQGHAITLTEPLRLNKIDAFGEIVAYECNGTPVDCVKLAKHVVLADRRIDLCVSGINHGSNASINVIYSGTMSAAMEASIEGIPSIGFSLLDLSFEADFTASQYYARKIIAYALEHRFGESNLINVNIPRGPIDHIKGIKICTQAEGTWKEKFVESVDPRGQKYYWLTGSFSKPDLDENSDISALENGYISVVPTGHNLTHYGSIPHLKSLEEI